MNSMVNYLMESGISLSLLALMYLLLLRKETFFRTNRLFLLFSVIFSLLLPLLTIPVYAPSPVTLPEITVTPYRNLLETVIVNSHRFSGSVENFVISSWLLVNVWFTGVMLMALFSLVRVIQIILIIRKGKVFREDGYKLVIIFKESSPFSFLNYLFVPENHSRVPGYRSMEKHELEHIRQGHTFDILLLDILLIFQWFNPLIWLLKRAVRENHEYLVDRAVLETGVCPDDYKNLLLSQVAGNPVYAAHHFNYSLLKNRFKMMTKVPSRKIAGIKIISGLLIALALVVVFACEQKKKTAESAPEQKDSVKAEVVNNEFRISGNTEDLKKINELLASERFEISQTGENGKTYLTLKRKEESIDINEEVFNLVEKMPVFPGGETALRQFIAGAVEYPESAQTNGIQGKVYVSFVVAKDGSVKNAKIVRGVDPSLDKEALRVVSSLPKWIPGEKNGIPVNVVYTVPISFVLQ